MRCIKNKFIQLYQIYNFELYEHYNMYVQKQKFIIKLDALWVGCLSSLPEIGGPRWYKSPAFLSNSGF